MKWIILIASFLLQSNAPDTSKKGVWSVSRESAIRISGSSNVNRFTLSNDRYESRDTLIVRQLADGSLVFEKGLLHIPVKNFRNNNPVLLRDFKNLLQSNRYPDMKLNFKSISSITLKQGQEVLAEVEITLKDKKICRSIRFTTKRTGNRITFCGNETMKFSDFGLQAPKNVMGFINVKNELDVQFDFAFTSTIP